MIDETAPTLTAPPTQQVRTHYQSLTAAVVIPAMQAVVTGLVIGLLAFTIAALLHSPNAWRIGLILFTASQALIWILQLSRWSQFVWSIETALDTDLNGDGQIGNIEPVRVEISQDEGRSVQWIDLPASQEQLVSLATGLLSGQSFSESAWTGRGAAFSRHQFRALRDLMIRRGLARWINADARAQGLELTNPGRAVMRRFAAESASPTLLLNLKRTPQ